MELKNKVVLITGASSGIGQATALRFAQEGCKVVVNYHINKKGAEETVEKIKSLKVETLIVKADISTQDDVEKLFHEIVKKFGTVDILVNNAAYPSEKVPFLEATREDILDLFNMNIVSAMMCSKKAIEIMKKQGYGKILNTSSIKGWEHGGGSVTYAVSKAAINSFTRTLAKQVAPEIQVNAVAPGYVKTRIYNDVTPEKIKGYLDGTYLKRWVTKEEIADAFVFLAKNDAMTGQIIYVDGGFTLK
jgi:3-oxoacyl-[acyl-carrier protein] reductase